MKVDIPIYFFIVVQYTFKSAFESIIDFGAVIKRTRDNYYCGIAFQTYTKGTNKRTETQGIMMYQLLHLSRVDTTTQQEVDENKKSNEDGWCLVQ